MPLSGQSASGLQGQSASGLQGQSASGLQGPQRPQGLQGGPVERESIRDAMNRASTESHQFNAKERAAYVKSMVECTKRYLKEGRSLDEIKESLPEFVEQYSYLFEMITNPAGYDEANLTTMLSMLEHMEKGNLTQHGASVIVGKRLYEKYGRPDGESE